MPKSAVIRWGVAATIMFVLALPDIAEAQGDDMARAKEAFSLGQSLYEEGKYEEAAESFKKSFDAFPHFRTIFNLALCMEKLEDVPAAVEMYERYLAWSDEVPARDEVEKKLVELKALLPPEPEPEPDSENEPEPGPDLRIPGWISLGVGAAGMITGGVMLGLASKKKSDIEGVENEPYNPGTHDAMVEDGERFEKLGWTFGGVGLALAATGVIMLILSDSPEEEGEGDAQAPPVAIGVSGFGEDGAMLSAGWRF